MNFGLGHGLVLGLDLDLIILGLGLKEPRCPRMVLGFGLYLGVGLGIFHADEL